MSGAFAGVSHLKWLASSPGRSKSLFVQKGKREGKEVCKTSSLRVQGFAYFCLFKPYEAHCL
jgi:hypothetical protein